MTSSYMVAGVIAAVILFGLLLACGIVLVVRRQRDDDNDDDLEIIEELDESETMDNKDLGNIDSPPTDNRSETFESEGVREIMEQNRRSRERLDAIKSKLDEETNRMQTAIDKARKT